MNLLTRFIVLASCVGAYGAQAQTVRIAAVPEPKSRSLIATEPIITGENSQYNQADDVLSGSSAR